MLKSFKYFAVVLLIALATGRVYAQYSFTIEAPAVVEQGETFQVKFVANSDVDSFRGPQISGADILAGPSSSRVSSTQIINGTRTSSHEVTYTYVLLAGAQSSITISPASVTMGGSTYNTNSVTIDVVSGSSATATGGSQTNTSQNNYNNQSSEPNRSIDNGTSYDKADVFLKLSLNKTKVVRGEPIIATLKIYTRNNIMGFEDIKFPLFNGFWSQEIETPQNINFTRETVGDKVYSAAVLRKYMIIPQRSGEVEIDPAELVVQLQVVSRQRRPRNIFDDFFGADTYTPVKQHLSTGKMSVNVSELPTPSPESFGGGVGKISMNVRVTQDSLKANEAASLIIELSGSGNLNLMEAPHVTFPSDFEKYEMKPTSSLNYGAGGASGTRSFEYPFIPRSAGDYTIPAIEYSYYDLSQRRYVTLHGEPISLSVAKGDPVATSTYISSSGKRSVGNIDEDIRYIHRGSPALRAKGSFWVCDPLFYLIVALLLLLYLVIAWLLRRRIALKGDIIRSKNKRANKVVRSRLRVANGFLQQNKVAEFYEELHKALLGYISDKLSIQFADMDRDTIDETLSAKHVDRESIDSLLSLIEECEMVRYSPEGAAGAMDAQYKKAAKVISAFENQL